MKKVLAIVLCAAMIFKFLPAMSTRATENPKQLSVYHNGIVTEAVVLPRNEKVKLTAVASASEELAYQWQILAYDDLWVNIEDKTDASIDLSYALVANLLTDGVAKVRCKALSDVVELCSHEISVTVEYAASVSQTGNLPENESVNQEKKVDESNVDVSGNEAQVSGNEAQVSGNDVEDQVDYTVVHYQQNLNDDNYTEADRENKEGYTGDPVGEGLEKSYEGFCPLLYDTTTAIAANGSTVVEIYYDRYYYLMTFDLDGGYGVEPIYARYGAQPTSFKAQWMSAKSDLTIQKILQEPVKENQNFIFEVNGIKETNTEGFSLTVVVNIPEGNYISKTVTLADLPIGSYTVTEQKNWRYQTTDSEYKEEVDSTQDITLVADSAQNIVTFYNKRVNDQWLSESVNKNNQFVGVYKGTN